MTLRQLLKRGAQAARKYPYLTITVRDDDKNDIVEIWCQRIYHRGGKFAWTLHYHARIPADKHDIGGWTHQSTAVDVLARALEKRAAV